jgi:AdoMet-dependent heme synthase
MNALPPAVAPPFLVAINLTRRCNLACAHCYLDAGSRCDGTADELTSDEVTALLDDIASLSDETMIVLTGGEPLLRPDLDEIARHAAGLGLMVVVGTNGMMLTPDRVARLVDAGVHGVGISLDSLEPGYHDDFRGQSGAWQKTMRGIDACRAAGLAFQIHFSVTDDNADELDNMIDFARSSGAMVLNVFFLVCTGRGETFSNISGATYDRVLARVAEAAHAEEHLMIRAKCAPHFKRLALELDPDWPVTLAHGYEAGGCLAGTRYCRITPEGEVTACPYIERQVGSVRNQDFADIWHTAPGLRAFRHPRLEGRCGVCEYAKVCGGCRARPLARDGNPMGEDFLCSYQPQGGAVIEPFSGAAVELAWTKEAEQRLARIPAFVRRFVRQGVETHARENGDQTVGIENFNATARRKFSATGPRFGAAGMSRDGGSRHD